MRARFVEQRANPKQLLRNANMPVTTIDPRAALIVVDLQKGLREASTVPHPMSQIVEQATTLAQAFRRRGLPVVLVNVTCTPPGRTDPGHSSSSRARPSD